MTAALTLPDLTEIPPRLHLVPDPPATVPAGRPLAPEVYRRRRLAVLAVVVGLVVGVASFGQANSATAPGEVGTDAVVVVVQPGDTLWGIAAALAPDRDPRPLVHELAELAGPGVLEPGRQLVIPRVLVD